MKSKLQIQTLAALSFLILSLAAAPAQPARPAAPTVNPATIQPVATGAPLIDPATGLPMPAAVPAPPHWIDENWADPNLVLTNVSYDNLPLSEVARDLREHFKNDFDILPMPQTFGTDWGASMTIQLQLKNVKASDVFNAMNLIFENNQAPLRWENKHTGNRQVVLLRVLPEAAPQGQPPAVEKHRQIYFIGNLLGDESGGMRMDDLIGAIRDAWPSDLGSPTDVFQFHKGAQLLVVNGNREQLRFFDQIFGALQRKVEWERSKEKSTATSSTPGAKHDLKSSGGGGTMTSP